MHNCEYANFSGSATLISTKFGISVSSISMVFIIGTENVASQVQYLEICKIPIPYTFRRKLDFVIIPSLYKFQYLQTIGSILK